MMRPTEIARRASSALLPRDLYLRCAGQYGDAIGIMRLGLSEFQRLRRARTCGEAEELTIRAPGLLHPLAVRPGTSDALVFENNIVRRSYSCVGRRSPRFIIDAGANVGYASAYFLSVFPEARVVALEPEPANAATARRNLAPYGDRVTLLEAALWPCSTWLRLRPAERADSVRVEESIEDEPGDCAAVDPLAILDGFGEGRIDLLKCDIEGGEEELFAVEPDRWLARTQCIVAEIHTDGARRSVYQATHRHGFRHARYRDLHVFERPGDQAW